VRRGYARRGCGKLGSRRRDVRTSTTPAAFATPVAGGNEYRNAAGVVNMGNGPIYHGRDNPSGMPAAVHGRWSFMVPAFDMCNGGNQIGNADFIVIDW
jgi:hypothetical protein